MAMQAEHETGLLTEEAAALEDGLEALEGCSPPAPPRCGLAACLLAGRGGRAAGFAMGAVALLLVGAHLRSRGAATSLRVEGAHTGAAVGLEETMDNYFGGMMGDSTNVPLTAVSNTSDGNVCMDDEEYFNKLCYRKCSILTDGTNPIRTSPWTCCVARPCGFSNTKHDAGMCSGYDVAGGNRKACPHAAGACLENEEFFMGSCYKKCDILAPGYPNRMMANVCCNTKGKSCFWPSNIKSSPDYNIGGGYDDDNQNTPSKPHPPIPILTES